MAQLDKLGANVTSFGLENGKFNWLHVAAGGGNSVCGGIALDFTHASTGAKTSVYFWCDSGGKLRYGTTVPTTATQDTAGTAIGS
jgi:hypothetical protein